MTSTAAENLGIRWTVGDVDVSDFGKAALGVFTDDARDLPWRYYGRPATDYVRESWLKHRPEVSRRVGLPEAAI